MRTYFDCKASYMQKKFADFRLIKIIREPNSSTCKAFEGCSSDEIINEMKLYFHSTKAHANIFLTFNLIRNIYLVIRNRFFFRKINL